MPTVTRVLPWRRHQLPAAEEAAMLVEQFRRNHPKEPVDAIVRAYELAKTAHEGQMRKSGEPYVTHPLAVATICAHYGMDAPTVIGALLHDVVEDTGTTLAEIEAEFGPTVRALVDGVTKLDRIHFDTKEAQQAATIRKMLVAMAEDIRVLVIKLADRLHNMRTIAALPAANQEATARETMEVYAPLAHRLGMGEVKQNLEDLGFAALYPKRYSEIDHMLASRAPERQIYLAQIEEELREELDELAIKAEITSRPKHLWSIYEKMMTKSKAFDEIFDLVGIRVVVDSEKDCYAALGAVHKLWTPVPGRIKDYVATPKFNLYQSLHTTVVGRQGKHVEVQIRTREMHHRAESGVAAHYSYKDSDASRGSNGRAANGARSPKPPPADPAWVSRMAEIDDEMNDPEEFMTNLKLDLQQDEIFVFTPKGDIFELPVGSTPVDFAYAVHTEVGHRCIGARVGGRLVPLDTPLSSGDTVEIFTSKVDAKGPSRDWLTFVATRSASSKIRQFFSRERRDVALETGREDLLRALRRESLPVQRVANGPAVAEVAKELKFASVDSMLTAIGEHHLSAESVAGRVARLVRGTDPTRDEVVAAPARPATQRRRQTSAVGVKVEGFDDLMVRVARCCTPVPGDEILGFVTRGRGVSVHRTDCANAVSLAGGHVERLVEVAWDDGSVGTFLASIEVKALDRSRLLQDVTQTISDHHANILTCSTSTGTDRVSKMRFEFELGDPSHLDTILRHLRGIDSVYDAYRVVPGK